MMSTVLHALTLLTTLAIGWAQVGSGDQLNDAIPRVSSIAALRAQLPED